MRRWAEQNEDDIEHFIVVGGEHRRSRIINYIMGSTRPEEWS
jgi:hypothetical protein